MFFHILFWWLLLCFLGCYNKHVCAPFGFILFYVCLHNSAHSKEKILFKKKDKTKCSHTPWRFSKYARLVLVKTKKRTLKFEGEVLLFCCDFLMSCSSRRIKLFMIQFLGCDAPWASPRGTTSGNSFSTRKVLARQLIFRGLLKGLLPPVLSLDQCSVNNVELLLWCQRL